MPVRTTTVTAEIGLHARAAVVFVRAVIDSGLPVTIAKSGRPAVDAHSLLSVMAQDFECGSVVELAIDGAKAEPGVSESVLDELVHLLTSQHGNDQS